MNTTQPRRSSMEDLRALFVPKTMLLFGISRNKDTPSRHLLTNVLNWRGSSDGIYLVNRAGDEIEGIPCYPTLDDLPEVPDLALILPPGPEVPEVVRQCGEKGIRAAIIFSAGFADDRSPEGQKLQDALVDAAQSTGIRVLGPNCLGYLNLRDQIAASWSSSVRYAHVAELLKSPDEKITPEVMARAVGNVACIAQSGGLGFSLFNRGLARGLRFSYVISSGNEADLEVQDFLEFLIKDDGTEVILLYVEGLKDAARFQEVAARAEQAGKHIVIAKVGRSPVAARAALSHTGHNAGDDAAFDAIFDRYGVVRVRDAEEMLDVGLVLSVCPKPKGRRAAVVSFSGGNAVWMADSLDQFNIELPELSAPIRERIEAILPSFAATANPVDISGASKVPPAEVLSIIAEDPDIDALILIATYNRVSAVQNDQKLLVDLLARGDKPVLLYSYTNPSPEARELLREIGIPSFISTGAAARALGALVEAGQHRAEPPLAPWPAEAACRTMAEAWDPGAVSVCEFEVKNLLAEAGLPVTREVLATSAPEAVAAAERLGYPVVLKIQSPDIPHKAERGGVVLHLASASDVEKAYERIMGDADKQAAIAGVLVQEMVPPGFELLVGIHNTSEMGPLVMVGLGGQFAEALAINVLYPAPFGEQTAQRLLDRLPIAKMLQTYKLADVPATLARIAALVSTVSRIAYVTGDLVTEMDLNPIIVDTHSGQLHIVDALAVRGASRG